MPTSDLTSLLSIGTVKFSYPNSQEWSLEVPGLQLRRSVLYSLKGDNMSGKTTMVKLLSGQLQPSSGALPVTFLGARYIVPNQRLKLYEAGLKFSHQADPMLPSLSIWDNMRLACASRSMYRSYGASARKRVKEFLEILGLQANDATLTRQLSTLSGGGIALMRLARAIAWGYRVLILDEPTANLDLARRTAYFDALEQVLSQESAIVLISHYPDDHLRLSCLAKNNNLGYRIIQLSQGVLSSHA